MLQIELLLPYIPHPLVVPLVFISYQRRQLKENEWMKLPRTPLCLLFAKLLALVVHLFLQGLQLVGAYKPIS